VQAASWQLRPAVLGPAPTTGPVDGKAGRLAAEVPRSGQAQQDRAEQDAVGVSGEPVLPGALDLAGAEQGQVRAAEVLNPADVHLAPRRGNLLTGRAGGRLVSPRLIHDRCSDPFRIAGDM
jgi:hypothetical protein